MDTSKLINRYFLSFDPTTPPTLDSSASDIAYNNGELYYFNGNTWVSLTAMPNFPVGGDLSGTTSSANVIGIQGVSVSNTVPTSEQIITFDGSQYIPKTLPSPPMIAQTADTFPNPDNLLEGQWVYALDFSFWSVVARRPHLELDGSQRNYYIQFANPGFVWRYNAGANTTADRLGRYDPIANLVYPITSLTDIPNCIIGTSTPIGSLATTQRFGRAISQPALAPGQTLVPGQRLTWNASGQVVAWTPASTTKAVGFYQSSLAAPAGGGSIGSAWTSYLPFV